MKYTNQQKQLENRCFFLIKKLKNYHQYMFMLLIKMEDNKTMNFFIHI
jgi:hypothetical protein